CATCPGSAAPTPTPFTTSGPTSMASRPSCACTSACPTPGAGRSWRGRSANRTASRLATERGDKGWGYYDFRVGSRRPATDSTSFMTAAALVALREAKDIGIEVPDKLIRGAVDSIHRQRNPDFSYLYGEYLKWVPQHPINRPGGSLGRSQACNVSLRLW